MEKSIICFGVILTLVVGFFRLSAQEGSFKKPITVGDQCPEFKLTEIHYFPKHSASLQDFRNKWLVLDFWTQGCVSCVESFPTLNRLQSEFRDEVQFLLIGKDDFKTSNGIRAMYNKFRTKQNLNLAVAYDTLIFDQFSVKWTPHVIVIDKTGIVRAVLETSGLTRENLQSILNGKKGNVVQKQERLAGAGVDDKLVTGDTTRHNTKRFSHLSQWDVRVPIKMAMQLPSDEAISYYKSTGISLRRLYNIAYFGFADWTIDSDLYGKFWRVPILELNDTSAFKEDPVSGQGFYEYELFIPEAEANTDVMARAIQTDLKKYFEFKVYFESRLMPYWRLEIYDGGKIAFGRPHAPKSRTGDHSGYVLKHIAISDLLWLIWSYHQSQPPFINETKILEPINVDLEAIMTDLEDINRALKENGFQLVKGLRQMRVMVLRDSN